MWIRRGVIALAAAFGAACSAAPVDSGSRAVPLPPRAETTDGEIDAGRAGGNGGSEVPPPSKDGGPPAAVCPAAAPTTVPVWKPPPSRTTSCGSSDFDFFANNVDTLGPSQLETQLRSRNAACASCVFTNETDAKWGPMVKRADGTIFRNYGACYARYGTACGQAIHQEQWCMNTVCGECNLAQSNGCVQSQMTGSGNCATEYQTFESTCAASNLLDTSSEPCATILTAFSALCGS